MAAIAAPQGPGDWSPQKIFTKPDDDHTWLGSKWGTDTAESVGIDATKLTATTHYDPRTGWVKSGIPLGKITASGLYAPYNASATDGTQVLAGFLLDMVQLQWDATGITTTTLGGNLLWQGNIVVANVPGAPTLNNQTITTGIFRWAGVDYVAPAAS
jgi:hypothetical protein